MSNGAISDDDTRADLLDLTRLKLARAAIEVEARTVNLTQGMAVSAEIETGKRRVIEYFLRPLLQYRQESLRER